MCTPVELLAQAQSLHRASRYGEALGVLDQAEQALGGEESELYARVQLARVAPLRLTGRRSEAAHVARQALERSEQEGWTSLQARALLALGQCSAQGGYYEDAAALAQRARSLAQQSQDPVVEAGATHLLAYSTASSGQPREAERLYQEALDLERGLGNAEEVCKLLTRFARLRADLGELDSASALAQEAADIARDSQYPFGEVKARTMLASLALRQGRAEHAARAYVELEALARALSLPQTVAFALNGRGEALRRTGQLAEAELCYQEAIAEGERAGAETALFRANLVILAGERGQYELAATEAERLAAQARGSLACVASGLRLAAYFALGRFEEAERLEPGVRRGLEELRLAEPDLALSLERAVAMHNNSADLNVLSLGARCLALAWPTWTLLERTSDAERVGQALTSLAYCGARIPIGDLDLLSPLGRGGMGEVWRASHRTENMPLAVKVLTSRAGGGARARAALHAELLAVARLNHPHIVRVYDYGPIGPTAERMSDGRLIAGSPYLAMELCAGSITPTCGRSAWPQVLQVLRELLHALAHAHARGLIHLDIKPDNVLFSRNGQGGVKLTDFGLARSAVEDDHRVAGTPSYMAPEQIRGRGRAIGPWTDLYALGGLAWALLTGEAPYGSGAAEDVMRRHLDAALPALNATCAVPPGLEAWLRRLLARRPSERFQRAADALRALNALGEPTLHPDESQSTVFRMEEPPSPTSGATFQLDMPPLMQEPTPDHAGLVQQALQEEPRYSSGAALDSVWEPIPERAPVPETWREDVLQQPLPALHGAGLNTFGMREVPMVGREAERDTLWQALRADRARVLVVRGQSGVGKTRLLDWLVLRSHELGAATPLNLGGLGIGPALVQEFRWQGLKGDALHHAVRRSLPDTSSSERQALCELVSQGGGHFGRSQAAIAAIRHLANSRAVVLCVDNAHGEPEALHLLGTLIAALPDLPLLGLVAAREDLLALNPEVSQKIEALAQAPRGQTLALGPLPDADLRTLLRTLLRLDVSLTERLTYRAAGNPLLALAVVEAQVMHDDLVHGEDGFRLREGVQTPLPELLFQLWSERLDRALQGLPDDAHAALELAAVMGISASVSDWEAACGAAQLSQSSEALQRLADSRLLEIGDGRLVLAHGMLRETLKRRAQEAGRLQRWHLAVVTGVPGLSPKRLGRHLVGGGRFAEAAEPLLNAARFALASATPAEALLLLDELDQALRSAAVPEGAALRYESTLERVNTLASLGRVDEAMALTLRMEERARRSGDETQLAEALRRQAVQLRSRGRLQESSAMLDRVMELLEGRDQPLLLARALHSQALTQRSLGDPQAAWALMSRALSLAEGVESPQTLSSTLFALGAIEIQLNREPEARAHMAQAIQICEGAGLTTELGNLYNGMAELDRKAGRYEQAEAGYRAALAVYTEGQVMAVYPRMNLALLRIAQKRWAEAHEQLSALLPELLRQGREGLLAATCLMLLAPSLALHDSLGFDERATQASRLLGQTGFAEPDAVWTLQVALSLAQEQGDAEREAVVAGLLSKINKV